MFVQQLCIDHHCDMSMICAILILIKLIYFRCDFYFSFLVGPNQSQIISQILLLQEVIAIHGHIPPNESRSEDEWNCGRATKKGQQLISSLQRGTLFSLQPVRFSRGLTQNECVQQYHSDMVQLSLLRVILIVTIMVSISHNTNHDYNHWAVVKISRRNQASEYPHFTMCTLPETNIFAPEARMIGRRVRFLLGCLGLHQNLSSLFRKCLAKKTKRPVPGSHLRNFCGSIPQVSHLAHFC